MRLISAGKMLNPDEANVKDFGLTENCYVHCVVTAAPPRLRLPSLTTAEQAEEEVSFFFFNVVFVSRFLFGSTFLGHVFEISTSARMSCSRCCMLLYYHTTTLDAVNTVPRRVEAGGS